MRHHKDHSSRGYHRTKWLDYAFWTGDPSPTPAERFRAIDQLAGYRKVEPWYWPVDGTEEEKAEFRRNLIPWEPEATFGSVRIPLGLTNPPTEEDDPPF